MFMVKSYREYIMTDGDLCAYETLVQDVQALQRIISKRPWQSKELRRTLTVKTQQLADIAQRYS